MTARADLHVHSKHSSKPSEWILPLQPLRGAPAEVRRLSGSPALEDLARIYTNWFYGQMDRVHVSAEMAKESRSRMTA